MGFGRFLNNATLDGSELRKRLIHAILICCGLGLGVAGQMPVFKDEFDKTAGTAPDPEKWTAETGGGGWGNEELQFYTGSNENAFHDGRGSLAIKALKPGSSTKLSCWYGECQYTSARLITKGKFDFKYGRIEARIKVPRGVGVWPAFWLLGNDIDNTGWPNCGEIDVMEFIGREASTVYGTLHGPGYSGSKGIGGSITLSDGKKVSDDFHIFSVEWTQNEIRWLFDGKNYKTITRNDIPKGTPWVFDHPFFIILNFAGGGKWPGSPDSSTLFPQSMFVDHVRVYELKDQQVK
ncbi:MAG TPA: glycoside hydrolase family 16 protein [Pyrinomonadaceae bacterium]|nr:glycoside hydrolase family 16 protein [Pyrinomonadaceae bacterium]